MPAAAAGQVLPVDFELVSLFQREDPELSELGEVTVIFDDPEANEITRHTLPVDLTNHSRTRIRIVSRGFKVRGDGIYWFRLIGANDEVLARVPLTVKFLAAEATEEE